MQQTSWIRTWDGLRRASLGFHITAGLLAPGRIIGDAEVQAILMTMQHRKPWELS